MSERAERYYVLTADDDTVMVMKSPTVPGHEDAQFDKGVRAGFDVPPFDFVISKDDSGDVLDFITSTFPGLVLSGRFKRVLDAVGVDNVEYFPVRVVDRRKKGKVHDDYFLANVVGLISCMDRGRSEFTTFAVRPDRIRSIENLQLDYSKIHGEKLFRLAEWFPMVLAHESVKEAVERAGLRGAAFIPAEGHST